MEPNDPVMIPMTRGEAARIHAALSALVSLQKAMPPTMRSALALTDAVVDIEGVLPRLADVFPKDQQVSQPRVEFIEVVPNEAKTYDKDPFDIKVDDVRDMSPQEAAAVFATQYDDAIKALLASLTQYTDFSQDNFNELLAATKTLLVRTMPVPQNISVKDSQPYVETSDLITLGALAYEMYQRQDQINEQTTKPF